MSLLFVFWGIEVDVSKHGLFILLSLMRLELFILVFLLIGSDVLPRGGASFESLFLGFLDWEKFLLLKP